MWWGTAWDAKENTGRKGGFLFSAPPNARRTVLHSCFQIIGRPPSGKVSWLSTYLVSEYLSICWALSHSPLCLSQETCESDAYLILF